MSLVVALLLGLRHATDPDHLTAVSTLLLNEEENGPRRAGLLGLSWGLGHATTLFGFGLPVVLFRKYLPGPVQHGAEAMIGAVVVMLALRLLVRWQRGYFHAHIHRHGSISHIHPHLHEHPRGSVHSAHHNHAHDDTLGRSPLASFGIGLVHGIGGSAGAGVLLIGAVTGKTQGVAALLVFAAATAASMSILSIGFAHALALSPIRSRLTELVPVFGTAGVLFGAWYSVGALQGWM